MVSFCELTISGCMRIIRHTLESSIGCNYTTNRLGYQQFFKMADHAYLQSETDLVEMHFAIYGLEEREPHILFSETETPGLDDDVLEIAFGAPYENWKTEVILRRRMVS